MAIQTEPVVTEIVAEVDAKSFRDGVKIARDTGKEIDQNLRKKLELDIAQAQLRLKQIKADLKNATDDETRIRLQVDANALQRSLTEAKRQLNNLSNTGDASLSRLQAKFNSVNDTIKQQGSALRQAFGGDLTGAIQTATAGFGQMGVAAKGVVLALGPIALIVGAFVSLGPAIFNATAAQQKYNSVLKNSLGSQEEASKSLALIRDVASKTPFEIDQLTESYIKLVNRGFKPTRAEIISLGDLASSQGKQFDQLVEALLDAQTGEFERLKEFGVRAKVSGDQVAFTFKGITTTVAKTDEAIKNYVLGLGQLQGVSGGMAEQSKTLGGQLSNLLDNFTQLAVQVGTYLSPLFEKLIGLTSQLTGFFLGLNTPTVSQQFTTLNTELTKTNAQMDALQKKLSDGSITIDEYTAQTTALIERKNELTTQLQIESDIVEKQNELYADNQKQISQNSELIKQYTDEIDAINAEKAKGNDIDIFQENILKQRPKQIQALIDKNKSLKDANVALYSTTTQVNDAIGAINTAKSRGEFDAYVAKARTLILTNVQLIRSAFETAKATGTLTQDQAKGFLDATKAQQQSLNQLQAIQKAGFSVPTASGSTTAKEQKKASGGSGKSEAQKRLDEEKKVAEEQKKLAEDTAKKVAEANAKATKSYGDTATKVLDQFDKVIESTTKKIDELDNKIKDKTNQIGDINSQIAQRAIALQQQLETLQAGVATEVDPAKKLALQEELAKKQAELELAKQNVSAEQLAKELEQSKLSDTEKLLQKRTALEAELIALEEQKAKENQILATARSQQLEAEKAFTSALGLEIQKRGQFLDAYIQKLQSASSIQGSIGSLTAQTSQSRLGNAVSNTVSNTNNFNISDPTSAESVARALSSQLL